LKKLTKRTLENSLRRIQVEYLGTLKIRIIRICQKLSFFTCQHFGNYASNFPKRKRKEREHASITNIENDDVRNTGGVYITKGG